MKEMNKAQNPTGLQLEEQEISYYLQERNSTLARFFLDDDILPARFYRPLLQHLLNAGQDDIVELYINSDGGCLSGAQQIIEGIRMSQASVYAIVTGSCHSAASMIMLNCEDVMITDSAESLVHCASYGMGRSKQSDVKSHVDFSTKQLEKLIDETYEGFLSPEEITAVKNGKELWFNAEELRERLEKRNQYFAEKQEAQEQAQKAAEKKPRKPKSKPSKVQIDTIVQDTVEFTVE